jgi:hypothetical protein
MRSKGVLLAAGNQFVVILGLDDRTAVALDDFFHGVLSFASIVAHADFRSLGQ